MPELNKQALKPCPFCGGEAEMIRPLGERIRSKTPPFYTRVYRVRCSDIGCCGCGNSRKNEVDAIAAWNTRAPLDALPEQEVTDYEQNQKDAARYHVLRSADINAIHDGGIFAGKTPENITLNGDDLDEALDKEIEKIHAYSALSPIPNTHEEVK